MATLEEFFEKKRKGYKAYKKGKKFKNVKKVSKGIKKGYKSLADDTSMLDIFK